MTLKELNNGDKFASKVNPTFVCKKLHQVIVGSRILYVCTSPSGNVMLSGDIEVVKL